MNMQQMMKQAQKLQKEMAKVQNELAEKEYRGSAGGDMVEVVVNGKMSIKKISISKEVVDPEDVELLEDLVTSAVNLAIQKANEDSSSQLGSLTGGLNIPGLA